MKHIKICVYKIKYICSLSIRRYLKIFTTFFAILGCTLTVAEFVQYIFESDFVYVFLRKYVWCFLIVCFIVSFFKNKFKLSYEYFLKGTDVKINLKVDDVLNQKAAIVIPTSTTFDTKMDDDFISENSIQGQFQNKYFSNNLKELDRLLEKGLEGYSYELINAVNSKNKRYPIGTVSKVTYKGKHYYFVAIADVNDFGKTINTKFTNVQLTLEGIWNHIENKGHIENLAIPLIGTGKAGIHDATRKKVIQEIIFSFVASSQQRKVTEKLQICIHPQDLEHKDLELEELNEYLKYMCMYRYVDMIDNNEGKVISVESELSKI